jgi:hypothetical protein
MDSSFTFSERKLNENSVMQYTVIKNYNDAVWSGLWANPEDRYAVALNHKTTIHELSYNQNTN